MKLRLLLGEAGKKKTDFLRREFLTGADLTTGKRSWLLVPEQMNLSEQKDLLQMQVKARSHAVLMGADVLSFRRLAFRILEENGQKDLEVLDDVGKSMVLYSAALTEAANLGYWGDHVHSAGFLSQLKELFSEFSQYRIDEEKLSEALKTLKNGSSLHAKLSDLQILYHGYEEAMKQYGEVSERLLDRLSALIPTSKLLINSDVYLRGFYDFSPKHYVCIAQLLQTARQVTIAIDLPRRFCEEVQNQRELQLRGDLWDTSRQTLYDLLEMLRGLKLPLEVLYFEENATSDVLRHLAKEFFHMPPQPYHWKNATMSPADEKQKIASDTNKIRAYGYPDRLSEVQALCQGILHLVRTEHYDYRDIAVVVTDVEGYRQMLLREARKYRIPIFMDESVPITSQPYVRMLLSLLNLQRFGCRYEEMMSLIKSGFTPFTQEQIDVLDNRAFYEKPVGLDRYVVLTEEICAGADNENAIHLYMQCLRNFEQEIARLKSGSEVRGMRAEQWCNLIRRFNEAIGAPVMLENRGEQLQKEGFEALCAVTRQLYVKVDEILSRIEQIMPEIIMSVEDFSGVFTSGLSQLRLKVIPPMRDQVVIGDMDRSRLSNVKALFIIGFTAEAFPHVREDAGLLTEKERAQLKNEFRLAPDGKEQYTRALFRFYQLLSLPSDHLYVSYEKSLVKGEAKAPSIFYHRFGLILGDEAYAPFPKDPYSLPEPEFQAFLERHQGHDENASQNENTSRDENASRDENTSQDGYASNNENASRDGYPYRDRDFLLERWFLHHGFENRLAWIRAPRFSATGNISPYTSHALWNPERWELSVSALRSYAQCPYAYFLESGLRTREREECKPTPISDGNVLHQMMENAGNLIQSKVWTPEELEKYIDTFFAAKKNTFFEYQRNSRYRFYWQRLRKNSAEALTRLMNQASLGNFQPTQFEWRFGSGKGCALDPLELPMADGNVLRLQGCIDRVDLLEANGETYVRIIDYKRTEKPFSVGEVEDAISLQLPIYMEAVREGLGAQGKNVKPAGMFYFRLLPKIIRLTDEKSNIENNRKAEDCWKGALCGTAAVLQGMAAEPSRINSVVNVKLKKDGTLEKKSQMSLYSEKEMETLIQLARDRAVDTAQQILKGKISAYPYRNGSSDKEYSACNYCTYKPMCYFDSGRMPYRTPSGMKKENL